MACTLFISQMPNIQLNWARANPMLHSNENRKGNCMSSITVTGVPAVNTPRGAIWAARGAAAIWAALARWFSDKPLQVRSAVVEAAVEAAYVRAMARRHAATDPGFAADLMAAADRHETQHDVR